MVLFPNCKINLGLYITSKRPDGYHNLETIFYPVAVTDAVEVIENGEKDSSAVDFASTGLTITGSTTSNLCVKAYHILKKDYPNLPAVKMHLHKTIPMGAGLGGGSSNGAFTLQLLNQKFNLGISEKKLLEYALQLGSDCPFFIINKPCVGRGRGEKLNPVTLNLSGYTLFIVNPGIHVSTKEAFANIHPKQPQTDIETTISKPVKYWKGKLLNDFEEGVFALHPELAAIKASLYHAGAVYAAMSGSGSSLFGLFQTTGFTLPVFNNNYWVKQVLL